MLSSADVAKMRTVAEEALPGTAVLYGGTLASDGGGGYSETFSAFGTVPCRLAPLTNLRVGEDEHGERITAEGAWTLTLPAGTQIETDDRIVTQGGTFNVVAVRDRDWEITKRVQVTNIE